MEQPRDFSKLSLSKWYSEDIAAFYGISKKTAETIKTMVEHEGGIAPIDKSKERKAVSADKVIQLMGGKDRLTEIQILNELRKYERNNNG